MKYLAAYCLAALGGNANPSSSDIEAILTSVGVMVDKTQLETALKALAGKKLHEVIKLT